MKLLVLQSPDNQSRELPLDSGQNVAGRDPTNALHLPSRRVSRKHCSFSVEGERVFVRDLGSSNGIVVEGQHVREAELLHGQRVQVGDYLLQFVNEPTAALPSNPVEHAPPSVESDNFNPLQPVPNSDHSEEPAGNMPFGSEEAEPNLSFGQSSSADNPFGPEFERENQESSQKNPAPSSEPAPSTPTDDEPPPFGEQLFGEPVSSEGGFGQQGFGALPDASTSGAAGYGSPFEQALPHATPAPENHPADSPALSGKENLQAHLKKIAWTPRVGLLLTAALLLIMLAPVGGVVSILSHADTQLEKQALEETKLAAQTVSILSENLKASKDSYGDIDYALEHVLAEIQKHPGVRRVFILNQKNNPILTPSLKDHYLDETERKEKTIATGLQAIEVNGLLVERKSGSKKNWEIYAPVEHPKAKKAFLFIDFSTKNAFKGKTRPSQMTFVAFIVIGVVIATVGTLIARMTNGPVASLREETELAIKGHLRTVTCETTWPELQQLSHSINRSIQRAGSSGADPKQAKQLALILNTSNWPIIIVDGSLTVSAANPVAGRILGMDNQQAIGKKLPSLIQNPELAQKMKILFSQIGGAKGKQASESVVMDGYQRTVSIAVETSAATGKLDFAVVIIA